MMLGLESLTLKLAFGSFILAKFLGIVGVSLGFTPFRFWGGAALIGAGVMLLSCIILCAVQMSKQNKEDERSGDAVLKMIQDGSIHERLREAGFKLVTK